MLFLFSCRGYGTIHWKAWGKGPVQGKIYNGPQYIEDNFPLIDKFLECTVTKSGGSAMGEDAVNEANEDGDGDGDDEAANAEPDDFERDIPKSQHPSDHIEKMPIGEAQFRRRLGKGLGGDHQNFAFPAGVFLVVAVLFVSLRGHRKDSAKMN